MEINTFSRNYSYRSYLPPLKFTKITVSNPPTIPDRKPMPEAHIGSIIDLVG